MHVGVFLMKKYYYIAVVSLPHARGGVSRWRPERAVYVRSSPCTWGCFLLPSNFPFLHCVFPMHVGVFLHRYHLQIVLARLPHARGGVSKRN